MTVIPVRLSTLVALAVLASRPTAAQEPATIPFAPDVYITQTQAVTIDSLISAQRDEGQALLARNDSLSRSVSARQRLRRKYQAAVSAVLTPEQRAIYDAWYAAAEAEFESRRPPATATP